MQGPRHHRRLVLHAVHIHTQTHHTHPTSPNITRFRLVAAVHSSARGGQLFAEYTHQHRHTHMHTYTRTLVHQSYTHAHTRKHPTRPQRALHLPGAQRPWQAVRTHPHIYTHKHKHTHTLTHTHTHTTRTQRPDDNVVTLVAVGVGLGGYLWQLLSWYTRKNICTDHTHTNTHTHTPQITHTQHTHTHARTGLRSRSP